VAGPPQFGGGVASAIPWPLGVVRPPPMAKSIKKKNLFGPLGWSCHPQGPRGGRSHPGPAGLGWLGWPKPPRGLWGWSSHP
jgi:hypothetical protein